MRTLSRPIVLFASLLFGLPLSAAVQYEFHQITKSEVRSIPSGEMSGRAVLDGGNSRVDFLSGNLYPPGNAVISVDGARKMYFLDGAAKTYVEVTTASIASALGARSIRINNLDTHLQKLDDHPIIAGLPTDHYRLQTSYDMVLELGEIELKQGVNTVIDKWTTSAFGDVSDNFFINGVPQTGNAELDKVIAAETSRIEGLPLKQVINITTKADNAPKASVLQMGAVRRQVSEMVVTSIRQVEASASLFQPPPDFHLDKSSPKPEAAPVHILSMEPDPTP